MENSVLISVVTPVFNGEQFLETTYRCLLNQTYSHWEWVVVDDGSTDSTWQMLQKMAAGDERVRCFTQHNSGSAKQPRDHAVYESHGDLLLQLDADDVIDDDYLEKMLLRQQQTNADIVYPQMVFVDLSTGQTTEVLPTADFDTTAVYSGRELVRETMPTWKIGCNGGLYRRKNWINMSYPSYDEPIWMNSDEVDERLYLLHAQRVAFASARYTYQAHPSSITHVVTPRQFQPLKTVLELLHIVEREFGYDSEEYVRANRKLFNTWRSLTALYVKNYRLLHAAKDIIIGNLRQCFLHINPHLLSVRERTQFLNFSSFSLLTALFCLKYSPMCLAEMLFQHFLPATYMHTIARHRLESQIRSKVAIQYEVAPTVPEYKPYTVCIINEHSKGSGLVDLLRGIVSTYMVCRECGREFKLLFTHPFHLTDYLEPNSYNWLPDEGSITFSPEQTRVTVCQTLLNSSSERRYQKKLLLKEAAMSRHRQQHVYTNASLCYDSHFAKSFCELFKPTTRLQSSIDSVKKAIAGPYITVSARFCNLLGDFNEEVYNEPLPHNEQQQLLSSCIAQLKALKQRYPDKQLVVCSDSTTFLDISREAVGAYIIKGTVSHIGNDTVRSYDYYEKTFLDFFTIAHADAVFLLLGPGMYRSGFPQAAAMIGGKKAIVIER